MVLSTKIVYSCPLRGHKKSVRKNAFFVTYHILYTCLGTAPRRVLVTFGNVRGRGQRENQPLKYVFFASHQSSSISSNVISLRNFPCSDALDSI